MKVKDGNYADYKTARQWAKKGYLPVSGATGVEMWANAYCKDSYIYYSPDDVAEATSEQIKAFFAPERAKRNEQAKARRKLQKEQAQKAEEFRKNQEQQYMIEQAVTPYLQQIAELRRIIRQIAKDNNQSHGGNGCYIIDTETTGLDAVQNELLQVSIIDSEGNIMFDSYFRPCASSWDDARAVNGISPDMVQDAPRISDRIAEINGILASAGTIIGYNTSFDLDFLENNGLILPEDVEIIDVMQDFAHIYGEWSEYHGGYKWQKLTTAAAYYGYDWNSRPEGAHNSLADCFATLFVFQKMQEDLKDT
jgi:DNA polymerase-3 subunit epsilon